jgi:hypothetical protein
MPLRTEKSGNLAGRTRVAAWLGVLALLVQALIPAAAMAASAKSSGGERIVVCTVSGVQTLTVGGHQKGGEPFAGLPCHNCLAASCAALPAPEPQVARIAYVTARVERPRDRAWAPALARAPPRPPGQGPPSA